MKRRHLLLGAVLLATSVTAAPGIRSGWVAPSEFGLQDQTDRTSGSATPTVAARIGHRQTRAPIDSARLLTDLSVLAHDSMEGRAPGTPGSERARRYIVASLVQMGVRPVGEEYEKPFSWSENVGVNVVAEIRGTEHPDLRIVLTAHYDHEGIRRGDVYNGADDNASGVAAVLAIARVLKADPLRHTIVLALLDAEEAGLQGARAFVADPPVPLESIVLNINLDMVARTAGLLWASGAHHTPALRPVLESIASTAPVALRLGHDHTNALEGDDWTTASDHAPFHRAGIPFVYFGVEDHADYHQPTDDFRRIVPAEYVASVQTILAATRALDAALPLPER